MPAPSKKKVYAVAMGRQTGIFGTWTECERQVKGFKGAKYKSFGNHEEAQAFLDANAVSDKSKRGRREPPEDDDDDDTTVQERNAHKKAKKKVDDCLEYESCYPRVYCRMNVEFDGGARGNPGLAGAGAVVRIQLSQPMDPASQPTTTTMEWQPYRKICIRHYVGAVATNNQAEYQGLCCGLQRALQEAKTLCINITRIMPQIQLLVFQFLIQGDSQLIIRQITGDYKCKQVLLKPYKAQVDAFQQQLQSLARNSSSTLSNATNDSNHDPDQTTDAVAAVKVDYVRFQHVLRELNKVADELGNQAMDAQDSWVTVTDANGIEGLKQPYSYTMDE